MKDLKYISLLVLVGLLFVNSTKAQQSGAWSSLDSNAIMIGDQVNYEFGITLPKDMFVNWPMFVDTLTSNIEIIKRGKIDTTYSDSDMSLAQQLTITSFDSGYFAIPPVDFKFKNENDSNYFSSSTGTLFLQVYVPEVDTSNAFKPLVGPIKEPYTLRELLPTILAVIGVLLLIALIVYYIIKRRKNQPVFQRKPKPIIPAHILAINKLEELRFNKVWQSGQLKKYYSELTDIIREYMKNRYDFDALEMTSYEILEKLHELDINKEVMSKMDGVLNLSDMVKFAKAVPTALENDLGLNHCVDFVNETKKVPEPAQTEGHNNTNHKESQ